MYRKRRWLYLLLPALLLAAGLATVKVGSADGDDVLWIRQFGTEDSDFAGGVLADSEGNVYVVGRTGTNMAGQSHLGRTDAYIRKYTAAGIEVWTRQFGTSKTDQARGIAADSAGKLYVIGLTTGEFPGQTRLGKMGPTGVGKTDNFLRKYDANGNHIWTRQFGTERIDTVDDLALDLAGNIYVAGKTTGAFDGYENLGYVDAYVRKYDTDGKVLWTRQFGTIGNDDALGLAIDGAGSLYVVGSTGGSFPGQTASGVSDAFVRKYDAGGKEVWTRQFGTDGLAVEEATGVSVDAAGNVYVAGWTDGALPGQTNFGETDAFLRKYDTRGNEIWTRQFGTRSSEKIPKVVADGNSNLFVVGSTYVTIPGMGIGILEDISTYLRKYDSQGNELWTRRLGTGRLDQIGGVAVDQSGNIYVVGGTGGAFPGQTNQGREDAFLVKFSGNGPASSATVAAGGGCNPLSGPAAKVDAGLLLLALLLPALLLSRLKSTP